MTTRINSKVCLRVCFMYIFVCLVCCPAPNAIDRPPAIIFLSARDDALKYKVFNVNTCSMLTLVCQNMFNVGSGWLLSSHVVLVTLLAFQPLLVI